MLERFLIEGGFLMVPIVILSVLTVMFVLERACFWIRHALRQDRGLRTWISSGDLPPKSVLGKDPIANILYDLASGAANRDAVAEARSRAEALVRESEQHLKVLYVSASIATSFGLLGTVVGVASTFKAIGLENPADMANGLSVALNTTIAGLIVFLLAFLAYTVYTQISRSFRLELEDLFNRTLRRHAARKAERTGT